MSFDDSRVRIELCDVIRADLAAGGLTHRQGAEIWLSDDQGKIRRGKPVLTLVDETRAGLLRQLADWIEEWDDNDLSYLTEEYASAKAARP